LHPTRDRARIWSSPRPILPPLILNTPKPAKVAQVALAP